ncbi:MAG: Endonuclease/exonuclease/phosphatase [Monoraphidium minutum]|nr:MAG: Endonuclease/exonuclease/phosphatase [Monoraphidium minutum]
MEALKVMSFNIRWDNPNEAPDDKWENRKGTCAEIVKKYRPHLLGMQEPHKNQVDHMAALLPEYGWFGKGRHIAFMGINEEHNELNPVFYDKEALTLEASGQWWYSDTPEIPNSKWGCSAFPRIATWGRFLVNGTTKRVCFINTHWDHESEEARTKAAEMLVAKAPEVSLGLPTVVVGDLNTGEGSPGHAALCAAMTECSSTCGQVIDGMMGKCGTFVGFDKSINSQIDFIFACQGAEPTAFGTVPDECPNGRCCSDHRPIMATLSLPDCPYSDDELASKAAAAQGGGAAAAAAGVAADKTKEVAGAAAGKAKQAVSALGSKLGRLLKK